MINKNLDFQFDTDHREHCLDMAIRDDNFFESDETFAVVARENPPLFTDIQGFIILVDTVSITVHDDDSKLNLLLPLQPRNFEDYIISYTTLVTC